MRYNDESLAEKVQKIKEELYLDAQKVQMLEELKKNEHIEDKWIVRDYEKEYYLYKKRYDTIKNSTAWRMTAPVRKLSDFVRHLVTGEKMQTEVKENTSINRDVSLNKKKVTIAVHLHLYYEELLEEFLVYFSHIPEPFDLYISCKEGCDNKRISEKVKMNSHINKVVVRECINRGRDLAPFYVLFRNELQEYEYLLHVHTKKSLYTGEDKQEWRHWALDGVLKDEKSVVQCLKSLRDAEPRGGLVFGEMVSSLPIMALHWLRNSENGRNILSRMHMTMDGHMLFYPVGSFFWAKRNAIQPLFDLKLSYQDFEEECGQIDGTLAHALERVIACVVQQRGYGIYIFNPETGKMALNKSYYSFKEYFKLNVGTMSDYLEGFDLITFDIFDTLITRLCYRPDDIFYLMNRLIETRYKKTVDFFKIRKAAERKAFEKYGEFTNINNIYEYIKTVSNFSEEESLELKQMEIELESELCIPRKDMLEVYNKLLSTGKKILLISDMYLPSEIIEKMLYKCGYKGYLDIWISCDKGKRKDSDTIWDDFFSKYGEKRTIHIGDNPQSDCQMVIDRKREAILILSPLEQFRLSQLYDDFEEFVNGSIEDSMILGYFVNKCLYNSPFALTEKGIPEVKDLENMIQGIFGPLFLKFMDYLQKSSSEKNKLLFLSREGYFLERLYTIYCENFNQKEIVHKYLLTSRRASSVPQIESYEDIKEILENPYTGKASTLLKERFGLQLKERDYYIKSLTDEKSKVLITLSNYIDDLLNRAKWEKQAYLKYIEQEISDINDIEDSILVDVGYAGSIQYYLMKLLGKRLDACYMVTDYKVKPASIDGTYRSLYSFWTNPAFLQTTLFLEAITAAPHGQVVHFHDENGKIKAVLKDENRDEYEKAKDCQKYIISYVECMGQILEEIHPKFNKELVSKIFDQLLKADLLSKELKTFFTVNDEYCNDGNWVYSERVQEWRLV